ncbi:MAG TPA: polysaccharide deacetylase family protein [Candidatus Latescibacteria bacterium]|jgi:peptidoglycan/xylan/chitin deacetylase (PgdA/CDA1 family)|nr:polysaccharide deacetylase family protein [Candidatus Latescibacterota bacterium]
MHIVSLSFDDGFEDSFPRVVDLYEGHGLRACLNIVATVRGRPGFAADVEGVPELDLTNFDLWNSLAARGHEIMPHTYCHQNLQNVSLATAEALIDRGLELFAEHLQGYDASRAIYNFAYNASTPEVEALLETRVRAWRTGGSEINPLPTATTRRITCSAHGPGNCEEDLDRKLAEFVASEGGWFVYNLHGLDEEGWGGRHTWTTCSADCSTRERRFVRWGRRWMTLHECVATATRVGARPHSTRSSTGDPP